uniref:Serine racemase n=1 Tax=Acrobeloides nanus TaxID=290746 RepID=A0A914DLX3_9BILA
MAPRSWWKRPILKLILPKPENALHHIEETLRKIQHGIIRTPCVKSEFFSKLMDMEIYLKKENLQYTGSFKARGALSAIKNLSKLEKINGIVAVSSGNHALALAYHAMHLGIPFTAVMPSSASNVKIRRSQECGANVLVNGKFFEEAQSYAIKLANKSGLKYIDSDDNTSVVFGQGTVALEILKDVADIDAILVPGTGGLIAGTTLAIKAKNPNIKIIGVKVDMNVDSDNKEPFNIPAEFLASVGDTGTIAAELVKSQVDDFIYVNADMVAVAMLHLFEHDNIIVECSAAVGLAALRSEKLKYLQGKKVVTVLTGGNIEMKDFSLVLNRARFLQNRLANCMR